MWQIKIEDTIFYVSINCSSEELNLAFPNASIKWCALDKYSSVTDFKESIIKLEKDPVFTYKVQYGGTHCTIMTIRSKYPEIEVDIYAYASMLKTKYNVETKICDEHTVVVDKIVL